jgi:hypothetical protein
MDKKLVFDFVKWVLVWFGCIFIPLIPFKSKAKALFQEWGTHTALKGVECILG